MMIGWGKIHKKNKPKGREGKPNNSHLLPKHIARCCVQLLYLAEENYMLLTALLLV